MFKKTKPTNKIKERGKTFVSFVIALVMCFTMIVPSGVTAIAAQPDDTHTVTLAQNDGGTVIFDDVEGDTAEFAEGDEVTLSIVPDDGYIFSGITLTLTDTGEVAVEDDDADSTEGYTFTMPAADITANAEFKKAIKHGVMISQDDGGTVSFTEKSGTFARFAEGSDVTLEIDIDEGYYLMDIEVVGKDSGDVIVQGSDLDSTTFSFKMPDEALTVYTAYAEETGVDSEIATYATEYGTVYTTSGNNLCQWARFEDGVASSYQWIETYVVTGSTTGDTDAYCGQLHHIFSAGEKTEYDALGWTYSTSGSTSGSTTEVTITQDKIDYAALGMKYIDELTTISSNTKRALKQAYEWRCINNDGSGMSGTWDGIFLIPSEYNDYISYQEQNDIFGQAWNYGTENKDKYNCWGRIYSNGSSQDLIQLYWELSTGHLSLNKSSANSSITSGNSCYSLKDAVYGVYASESEANNDSNRLATLTTDDNGNTNTVELEAGDYYVKEITESKGYYLCDSSHPCSYSYNGGIHFVTVESGETATVHCQEVPKNDPYTLTLYKLDDEKNLSIPQGEGELAGAEFTIKYYDGYYSESNLPSSSTKTWVIQTKYVDGKYRAGLSDTYKVSGDGWYYDNDGVICLPLGTISIEETKAPEGYLLPDNNFTVSQVTENGGGASLAIGNEKEIEDPVQRGDVDIAKWDKELVEFDSSHADLPQGDATLTNATFEIINDSTNSVIVPEGGTEYDPGEVVMTITTSWDSSQNRFIATTGRDGALPYGHYIIREVKAPTGYLNEGTIEREFDISYDGEVVDYTDSSHSILNNPIRGGIIIAKWDKELVEYSDTLGDQPQGDATLAGAVFEITNTSDYCVLVDSDDDGKYEHFEPGEVVKTITTEWDESLQRYVARTDADALPYGSYHIEEVSAPTGYLNEGILERDFEIREEGVIVDYTDSDKSIQNNPIRGGLEVQKRDVQTLRDYPEGNATFEGATITITNESTWPVLVEGVLYNPGDVVKTLVTDEVGYASTSNDLLPYGTYLVKETVAPEGYLLGNDTTHDDAIEQSVTEITVEIREDGKIYNLTGDTTENGESYIEPDETITDLVKRGDVSFVKQDGENQSTDMGSIPFRITSRTTGESHVIWTDENGDYSSDSTWNKHTYNTNAGEDEYDGLWFYGYDDAEDTGESTVGTEWRTEQVDDNLGALPYDTYDMDELPCEANEGYTLVHTSFVISRDIRTISLGTIDNYKYSIDTSATDATTGSHNVTSGSIHDLVIYTNLEEDADYTLVTKLYDLTTHEMVLDEDGEELTVEHEFTAHADTGSVEVLVDVNMEDLYGHTVVVYEYLYDEDGNLLKGEEDPDNEEQTVTFSPNIQTMMVNNWTGEHQATIFENHNVDFTDTVSYEGLTPGKTYVVRGTLMDKETGAPLLDANGEEVHSDSEPFIAEESSGEITVDFDFLAYGLHGTYTVAYEYLYELDDEGNEPDEPIASHEDIDDENQTVQLMKPTLWTEAGQTGTGESQIDATDNVQITDMLDLTDLIIGHTYYVYGKAVDQEGNQIYDATTGEPVELYIEFVADAEEMELDIMQFEFDATGLDGQAVVFEEYLYADPDRTILITEEEDLGAIEETIFFNGLITIGTELIDDLTGTHVALPSEHVSLTDTVSYEGLTPGETYTVTGILMDKATGEPLLDENGDQITAESDPFVPEEADGEVTVTFEFDGFDMSGTEAVAFEYLYDVDSTLKAVHEDIDDEAQMVTITGIEIGTTATETGTGNKTVEAGDVSITDTVTYSGVIEGMDYTMTGYAVDPETAEAITDANGNVVTASQDFTAESTDGTIDMIFQFDASELDGKTIVFVEYLYQGDELVGYHYDLEDEGQSMTIENPITTYVAPKTGVMGALAAVIAAIAAGGAIMLVRRRRIVR